MSTVSRRIQEEVILQVLFDNGITVMSSTCPRGDEEARQPEPREFVPMTLSASKGAISHGLHMHALITPPISGPQINVVVVFPVEGSIDPSKT
jgi:hypothetical protein